MDGARRRARRTWRARRSSSASSCIARMWSVASCRMMAGCMISSWCSCAGGRAVGDARWSIGIEVAYWAERASLPVAELEDTATVRLALAACARTLTGKAAAGSTQRRKRSVFYNALGYAVEQGHLPANPVDRIQWTTPAVAASVDRRVVVSPAQARQLLAAVRAAGRAGGSTWRRSSPACTTPRCAPRRRSCSARPTCTCRRRVGEDRPGRLGLPGGHGLDRPRHRPPGTRPEAPRRQRDPDHPHPARTGPAAARPHQAVRHHPGRADLPDRPGRHPPGLRLQRGLGPRPARRPSPPPSTGRRSAAAPTTCGTRRCRCG